jgi:hypothetical protein
MDGWQLYECIREFCVATSRAADDAESSVVTVSLGRGTAAYPVAHCELLSSSGWRAGSIGTQGASMTEVAKCEADECFYIFPGTVPPSAQPR